MSFEYRKRYIDEILKESLVSAGAVLIEGPKWCGKTSTAEQIAKSTIYMDDPDNYNNYMNIYNFQPSQLLEGNNPRLIDEWQLAPKLWDAARFQIDRRKERGLFILTGSSLPILPSTTHSGVGRFSIIRMSTMTLFESGESNGCVSIKDDLLQNKDIKGEKFLNLDELVYLITRGGWPALLDKDIKYINNSMKDYISLICKREVQNVDGVDRRPEKMLALLQSLARNIGSMAKKKTIIDDINSYDEISEKTFYSYMSALKNIFVVDDVNAWSPSLRSKISLRKTPKRYFVDPSIAVSLLRANKENLMNDFNTFGFLFESLVIRDLKVYANNMDAKIYHYRDSKNNEVDAIISFSDLNWAAIEIKLSNNKVAEAIKSLLNFKKQIDTNIMKEPLFMMVIIGSGYAYRDKSGVYVVPIACLKD